MKTCSSCPNQLGSRNKSGRCRSCSARALNACPHHAAKRAAGIARAASTPEGRAKLAANARKLNATYWKEPENAVRRSEHGKHIYATVLCRPDVRELNAAAVSVAAKRRWKSYLSWCPPEHRAWYQHLVRSKHVRAAEAKRIVLEHVASEKARRKAERTFEEKLALLEQGKATVSNNLRIRSPEPSYSLIGNSGGML